MLAPSPASILNHKPTRRGIPIEFSLAMNCSSQSDPDSLVPFAVQGKDKASNDGGHLDFAGQAILKLPRNAIPTQRLIA